MLRKLLALSLLLAALAGCAGAGNSGTEAALELRTKYIGASEVFFKTDMIADYGDKVYDYTLEYSGDGSTGIINVISPEEIEGITVEIKKDGLRLGYRGAMIDTGALYADGLSPVEAFPAMIDAWRTGYVISCRGAQMYEKDCLEITFNLTEYEGAPEVSHTAWFDSATLLPVAGEIISDGRTVLTCKFTDAEVQ